jgi:hypothetical protein
VKNLSAIPMVVRIVFVLALVRAWDLVTVWLHSPLDRLAWIAFLAWTVPAFWCTRRRVRGRMIFSACALFLAVVATVTDRHAFGHIGLAFSIAAIAGFSVGTFVWLATSIGWMPLLTWFGLSLPWPAIAALRFVIVGVGIAVLVREIRAAAESSAPPASP